MSTWRLLAPGNQAEGPKGLVGAILEWMSKSPEFTEKKGVFLASNAALDFLNTEWPTSSGNEDFFESDEDVFAWLRQAGLAPAEVTEVRPIGALLRAARALRDAIRAPVESRNSKRRPDFSDLNAFLSAAQSYPQLTWTKSRTVALEVVRPIKTAEQLLAPVALAASELLAIADFTRVRKCDDPTCVHWFHDLTRPGKRRWCSMATCGNRLKVKSYRRRKRTS